MKKYLLASGVAATLLLAACSEEGTSEVGTEEDTALIEESEAEATDVETTEEVTEEETAEEVTEEEATVEEVSTGGADEADPTEEIDGEARNIKEGFNLQLDSVNVSLLEGGIVETKVTEDLSWYFTDYEVGDNITIAMFEFEVENTVDEERSFYLDQTTLITSAGEQVEADLFMAEGLQSEMYGAVSSRGTVPFVLKNTDIDEVEWVDIIIPWVSDAEWNTLTEEQKVRVELEG